MRKVTISNRSVYHKYAEVTIEVPNDIEEKDVDWWVMDNEDKWLDLLGKELSYAEAEEGAGLDEDNGMCEYDAESETRYDLKDKDDKNLIGGHL